jgi:N4-gp56 family major capsid protein
LTSTTTGTANFGSLVNLAIQAATEQALRANLVFASGFDPYVHMPGTNIMRRGAFADIAFVADSTTALTEGTPPTSNGLTIAYDSITAVQRGLVLSNSDLADFESPYQLAAGCTSITTQWAAQGMDLTAQAVIDASVSSSTVIYSGTATSRATVATKMTGAFLKTLVARLRMLNVEPFPDGYYRAALSPRQIIDLVTDTAVGSLTETLKYTDASALLKGEVGEFAGARIMSTTRATTYATAGSGSVDVIRGYVWGQGYLGLGDIKTIQFFYTPPGGQSDPLYQNTKFGAKFWLGAVVQTAAGTRGVVCETVGTILAAGQA